MAGRLDRVGPVRRGDVRLCAFPTPDKRRPVVVLTRSRLAGVLQQVVVVPVTSTMRGVDTEVPLGIEEGLKGPCVANALNVVTVPRAAMGPWLGSLSVEKRRALCRALAFATGCTDDDDG